MYMHGANPFFPFSRSLKGTIGMVFKRETASNAIGGGARTYLPLTYGPSPKPPFPSFR